MKNILISVLLSILASIEVFGQIYEVPQKMIEQFSMKVYCCGLCKIGEDGYYNIRRYEEPLSNMDETIYTRMSKGSERFFCYLEKENRFYFYTDNFVGYYIPANKSCSKFLIKKLKKSDVKKLKIEDAQSLVSEYIKEMGTIYKKRNDSIAEVKRVEREKFVRDSVETAQRKAREKAKEMDEYRRTHDWRDLAIPQGVWCSICEKIHKSTLRVLSMSADSIYYLLTKPDLTIMGYNYHKIHYGVLTRPLKDDIKFKEYVEIWQDSIANNNTFKNLSADLINAIRFNEFKADVCNAAPNGFISSWGWRLNSADGIEPHFSYFNTSNKTIKYVDLYFSVYNAVGDRCYLKYDYSFIGFVRGVGPIEPFDYGSWKWDRATHYTTADATEMRIVKLVITYMDGTSKTIPEKLIKYDQIQ